jgi:hypothetical protein
MKTILNQIRKAYKLVTNVNESVEQFLQEGTPVQNAVNLKALEQFIKAAKTRMSEDVLNALEQENNQQFQGFKVYKTTSATRYDFSHNEDWSNYQEKIDRIKAEQKEIEDNMKLAYNKGITILNDETGEVYEPALYKSGGKDTFAVK